MSKKQTKPCDICGKGVTRYKSEFLENVFCSRSCSSMFLSARMSLMNKDLNPTRMTKSTREKLSRARKTKGNGRTYSKTGGRHDHRRIAEEMLGRPLKKGEIVHHEDENKRNNDPSNLKVFASQADHARYHMYKKLNSKNANT